MRVLVATTIVNGEENIVVRSLCGSYMVEIDVVRPDVLHCHIHDQNKMTSRVFLDRNQTLHFAEAWCSA